MSIPIHYAVVELYKVNKITGDRLPLTSGNATIKEHLNFEHRHYVRQDQAIANTIGNVTVKAYLEAEAADNFVLKYMDQYTIITYDQAAMNNAT